jgi:TolB-like protein
MRLILKSFVILFLSVSFNLYAAVEVVTKTFEGQGRTTNQAIEDALVNAVTSINGLTISSNTISALLESSININKAGEKISYGADGDVYLKTVIKNTNGIIKNYELISEKKEGDIVKVQLNVSLTKLADSIEAKRLRLALLPFKTSESIQSQDAELFDSTFSRYLVNNLTNTGRFGMMDRQYLEQQSQELDFIKIGGTSNNEMAKLGNRLGADYIITGTYEKVKFEQIKKKSRVSDKVKISTKASAEVTFRLIDVATTIVKFAKTYKQENNNSVETLAKDFAKYVSDNIVETLYPIRILSSTGSDLIIGQGGDSVKKGQKFAVYQLGRELKDPYTRESLGREEIKVGLFQVSEVKPKFSHGNIIEGNSDLKSGLGLYRYILRPYKDNKMEELKQQQQKKKKAHENNTKKIERLRNESESDW